MSVQHAYKIVVPQGANTTIVNLNGYVCVPVDGFTVVFDVTSSFENNKQCGVGLVHTLFAGVLNPIVWIPAFLLLSWIVYRLETSTEGAVKLDEEKGFAAAEEEEKGIAQ